MYFLYFFLFLSILQFVMFRMPGLLLILVVAYAIYSFVQSRRLRQSTSGFHQGQSSSNMSSRKRDQDIFDVEYTEHEL